MAIRYLRLLLHYFRDNHYSQRNPHGLAPLGLPWRLWCRLPAVHLDRDVRPLEKQAIARSLKVHSCLPSARRFSRYIRPRSQEVFLDMRGVSVCF